jgi:predicted nucleic acid-binding protein
MNHREDFLALVTEFASLVAIPKAIPDVLPDAPDNLILAAALSGDAHIIVSGDRALQQLHQFQGVRILSASEFLAVLAGAADTTGSIEP